MNSSRDLKQNGSKGLGTESPGVLPTSFSIFLTKAGTHHFSGNSSKEHSKKKDLEQKNTHFWENELVT